MIAYDGTFRRNYVIEAFETFTVHSYMRLRSSLSSANYRANADSMGANLVEAPSFFRVNFYFA